MDPTKTYQRRWFTLLVLCISLMVIGVDNTILNVALPTLSRELHASTSQLQWIVDAYTIVFAGLLLTAGSLGDRFGRKRALTFGLSVFGIGSLMSALAGSATQLIATRALMGVGAAFIMPATLSILTNVFTVPDRAGQGHRHLGRRLRPRHRHRAAHSAASCSSSSGGGRSSSSTCRWSLIGLALGRVLIPDVP